jgi:dTDP-4-dehydrorhamnose 3,5-epimerase
LYNKESEGNIVYNDPDINVEWGVDNPILSEKDKIGPTLREFVTPF